MSEANIVAPTGPTVALVSAIIATRLRQPRSVPDPAPAHASSLETAPETAG